MKSKSTDNIMNLPKPLYEICFTDYLSPLGEVDILVNPSLEAFVDGLYKIVAAYMASGPGENE